MHKPLLLRLLRLLWLGALLSIAVDALYPVSTGITRAAGLAFFAVVWFGLPVLGWRRRVLRFSLLGLTLFGAGWLALPARRQTELDALRREYVTGLRRYEGVSYVWGGESFTGIDCSGLVRRGLVDALFCRGVRTLDPGLVRDAVFLWWHDRSASELGAARAGGPTVALFETPSLNALDHARLRLGDMAFKPGGIHVLAYLGDNSWIEADPTVGRVITTTVPSPEGTWSETPMRLVRWEVLGPG